MKHCHKLALLLFCILSAAGLGAASANAADAGEVVVYNWSDYIPDDILKAFTKETGIKVIYSTYESNEAMHAKVKVMKGKSYDLVCPSTYMMSQLISEGLVQPLDHSKIPNMKNVDPKLMDLPFDKGNKYSMPYMWGNYGIIVNTKKTKEPVTSWNDLLRPEFKGKVMLYDDPRMTIGMALLAVGASPNTHNEEDLKKAFDFLSKVRESLRVFDVTAAKRSMVNEEATIGAIWNGDGQLAIDENEDLTFIYPKEGVVVWLDSFGITSGAANVENAHKFINYMLRPEVALRCLQEYGYSTPNLGTLKLMDKDLAANRTLNPTPEDLKKSVVVDAVGDAQRLYNLYWEKFITNMK